MVSDFHINPLTVVMMMMIPGLEENSEIETIVRGE
jgi:hypothetical protein